MKNILLITLLAVFTSCGSVWDEQISAETIQIVLPQIQASDTLSEGKKKYLAEMMPMTVGLASLAELAGKSKGLPTYRDILNDFSRQYDSTAAAYRIIRHDNEKLDQLIELRSVKSFIFSEHSSMIGLDMAINNTFEKDILYIILEYELIDKYDTRYFSHRAKLTDQLIEAGKAEVSISHKYDDVSRYLWSKAPSDDKKRQAFFDENFRVRPLMVVFADKTEVTKRDAEWEYL